MKFIFQTMPAYGHLNPMLGVAEKLIQKGHHVIVYNTLNFKEKIEAVGAQFREPEINIPKMDFRILHNATNIARLSLYATELMALPLIKIIEQEKLDCLVHDSLSLWSKIAGIKTKIPTIALVPSMGINIKTMLSYTQYLMPDYIHLFRHPISALQIVHRFNRLYWQMKKLPPLVTDMFANKEKLNIVFTSEYFQPRRQSFDITYKFVGPIIYKRYQETIPLPALLFNTKKPIIYVSLGTVYNDDVTVYRTIINSLKNISCQVFISTGKYIKSKDLGKIPDNMYIKDYLPQLKILKKASLFISHAGMNSVNESLYFGVPMLMLPHIQEQKINADRVEELKAGIHYKKKKIDVAEFANLINKVLTNLSYKKHAKQVQKTLNEAGGAETAVKYMLDYLNKI